MDLTIVKALPDYLVKALCGTLIHSLWQGVLLAALAGIIVVCTRRSGAAIRYNLLMAGLALFACTVAFTFIYELNQVKAAHPLIAGKQVTIPDTSPLPGAVSKASDYQLVSGFLNAHSSSIVFIWLLVVMARTLQLMTGLQSLYYLRRRQVLAVNKDWENRVKELAQQLGIKRLISVAESGMAKVPMVIGHLKPLILIPAGLMTAMPPAEIEAILIHELAHIHRRDYIMNLLVSIMEIAFFFNPAVLWIASLIRAERENCCDDIVVARTGSKVNYIKALVACQEYQLTTPAYAMALGGSKKHLMGRVQRMLSNNNQSLNVMERSVLAIGLGLAILFTAAFSNKEKIDRLVTKVVHVSKTALMPHEPIKPKSKLSETKRVDKPAKTTTLMPQDTPHKQIRDTTRLKIYHPSEVSEHTSLTFPNGGVQTHLLKLDGVLYQVNSLNDRITSMQVNGNTIRPGEYAPYLLVVDKEMQRSPQVAAVAPTAQVARQPDPITPINGQLTGVSPQTGLGKVNANLGSLKGKLSAYSTKADGYNAAAAKYSAANPYPANYKPYHDDTNREKLTNDLITEGILHNQDELTSFKLSDSEFIVNGKKMPDDVYQKFKKAYVKLPENGKKGSWSWMYNYTEETDSTTGDHSQ
jgi:bla regulator protein BlaR1